MTLKLAGNPQTEPQLKVYLKNASQNQLPAVDPRSTRALIALMDMYAVLGGAASHYGGPAAMAELLSALHAHIFDVAAKSNKQWYDLFHVVNDAGHCENGLYALKANYKMAGLNFESLKKFRSIESPLTGHGEVHCFPEGVFLSNGPLGSAFPQTQGLAMGEKLSGSHRLTYCVISDGACMEGEAKEAFAAIPGLAKKGQLAPYVLIISDNNTKLSGRIDKDSFSLMPTFDSLSTLGWKVFHLENGHDLQKCYDVIVEASAYAQANPTHPVAIHAKTIKGIGSKKTAESSSGGHGFPLKSPTELKEFITEIYAGESYPGFVDNWIEELIQWEAKIKASGVKDSGEKIQNGVASAMIQARKDGLAVVSVTSDLPGSTGVAGFRKEFPQFSFDVGVAESNMTSAAVGFSKTGFIPVIDTFAQFGVTKGALPLTMASLSEAPVIAIFSHTGFQDAADGASHQALSYIAMVSAIPHVEVYTLTCSEEAHQLVYQAIKEFDTLTKQGKTPPSYIFFLGRENFPKSFGVNNYKLRTAQVIADNTQNFSKNITLAVNGSLIGQALLAAKQLADKGIGTIVVNPVCINKIDTETMKLALKKTNGNLLTIEDHQLKGGMGAMLIHALVNDGLTIKAKSLGVKDEFGQSAYTALELYKKHGLDADSVVQQAQKLL